ncbi:hypothetical protein [Streptomyces gardneri]|uniref:hypothetical protein n=1 Tax=Streptomyces gardneri TaxID=66892 RepID=UPI0036C1129F
MNRDIDLAAGNYRFAQTNAGSISASRTIWLKAGNYGWQDCLEPYDGYYKHLTFLVPPVGSLMVSHNTTWTPGTDGNYTWGSYLNPFF